MGSAKQGMDQMAALAAAKGIEKAVLSPGSRNAPIVIALSQNPDIDCYSIVDERSAGFFALGMAQQSRKPVIITCTSGSAALNYAPAIVEAFYQEVPMLVVTADRPVEWIDQGDGQTIRQRNLYQGYVKGSYELMQEAADQAAIWHNERTIAQAIDQAMTAPFGPVHINVPLREPLYELSDKPSSFKKLARAIPARSTINPDGLDELVSQWNSASRKMILCGQLFPNPELKAHLNELTKDPSVVVLTETQSNVSGEDFISAIDKVIFGLSAEDENYGPDLLLTLGGQVISKKIKQLLRGWQPAIHWHAHPGEHFMDTYQSLTHQVPVEGAELLNSMVPRVDKNGPEGFKALWHDLHHSTNEKKAEFLAGAPFSDLKAFEVITKMLPKGSQVQMANSSTVRYVQLFGHNSELRYFSNRGTSGIEGCTSTAAGAAEVEEGITTLITGDLAFLYDANGLWNNRLPGNLRIIVINNGGGGIFRFIPGPSETEEMEPFIEAHHTKSVEQITKAHGVGYQKCENEQDLETLLPIFFQPHRNKALVLEVMTPREENDKVLKSFFNCIGS